MAVSAGGDGWRIAGLSACVGRSDSRVAGLLNDARGDGGEVVNQSPDGWLVEAVRAVVGAQHEAAIGVVRREQAEVLEHRVRSGLDGPHVRAGEPQIVVRHVLQRKEQGRHRHPCPGPAWSQRGLQTLNRHVLMREEPGRATLHAGEQIQERRIARQVRAQRQDIRKQADQRFQLRVHASGRRRDDHEVRLVASGDTRAR